MNDQSQWVELAVRNLGAEVLEASDDFFASKDNLLKPEAPIFEPGRYTDRGKWMDGWESRRKREPGFDWCVIRLGVAGIPRRVDVDTSFFDGNHPQSAALEAAWMPQSGRWQEAEWWEVLPRSELKGNSHNVFDLKGRCACRLLRLNIHPDGGVARLRVHGEVAPDWERLAAGGEFDLACLQHGATVVAASDMHFGSRHNLILPGRPPDMREGWETRRRRGPGFDWCVLRLAGAATLGRVEIDTTHFKGNYPDRASLEGCRAAAGPAQGLPEDASWQPVLGETQLQADHRHPFDRQLQNRGPFSHLRLNIFPDGGVSRLRAWGRPTSEGWTEIGLRNLDALPEPLARQRLAPCCGSRRWQRRMVQRLPLRDPARLHTAADECWESLQREDVLEAFAAHPRIGEKKKAGPARESGWSAWEQSGMQEASDDVRRRLAEANQAYQRRFGYIFLINATGKSAARMLESLEQRLGNDPEEELAVAAEQQRQIIHLRLEKLFQP